MIRRPMGIGLTAPRRRAIHGRIAPCGNRSRAIAYLRMWPGISSSGALMRLKLAVIIASVTFAAEGFFGAGAQAVTLETTNFISSPTYFNGFEGINPSNPFPGNTYSEGGITVTYKGSAQIDPNYTSGIGGQGNYGWYPNGGGIGYTDVILTGGGSFQAIQFLAGSGFGAGPPTYMDYEVLNNGSVVSSGNVAIAGGNGPMQYFGFSGGGFNEILLQNQGADSHSVFNPNAIEAGAYDSFAATPAATPLPAALPLFATGLGVMGFLAKRRKRKNAALAAA
jgi:hypothetical protein